VPGDGSIHTLDMNELVQTYGAVKVIRDEKKKSSKNPESQSLLPNLHETKEHKSE
jgi:hypothetical protein